MKKLALTLAAVLGLVTSMTGEAEAGKIQWNGERKAELNGKTVAGHAIALKTGWAHVGVVTKSRQDVVVKVFRLEKDLNGKAKLVSIKVRKVSRDGTTLLKFHVDRPAPYLVLIGNKRDSADRYVVLATGEFFGKPFVKKIGT